MTQKQAITILNKVRTKRSAYSNAEERPSDTIAGEHEVSLHLPALTDYDVKDLVRIAQKFNFLIVPGIDDKGAYVEFCIY